MRRLVRRAGVVAAATLALLVVMVTPVSAKNGATQIGGVGFIHAVGEWTDECPDPGGDNSVFADFTLELVSGNLQGCWYQLIEEYQFSPNTDGSFVYHERGRELFVGYLFDDDGNNLGHGTFETTYLFTGKFEDASFAVEIHGRCQHPIVDGTGTGVFEGMTGRVDFKDNVETGELYYRGHLK